MKNFITVKISDVTTYNSFFLMLLLIVSFRLPILSYIGLFT